MLTVENLEVSYGAIRVLKGVNIRVNEGELVAVIGANGAGKSTLVNTISGLLTPRYGTITFNGEKISGMPPHHIVSKGVVQVPEGRQLFPMMNIRENLEMGSYLVQDKNVMREQLEAVHEFFPILKERENQKAGTLSGGEQQMLAVGRALMSKPKLLMFDEPSLGLAPKLVQTIFDIVIKIREQLGVSVMLIEQNVKHSCEISDRAIVLENGHVTLEGTGSDMLNNEQVRRAYLGL
jgi:branched-chain amino acid transport system ATP-binding protein